MRSIILVLLVFLCGCHRGEKTVKVAATSIPHGEILEFIKPEMEKRGYVLDIVIVDDYQLPNRLLAEGEVDANFFQHLPFLESQQAIYGNRLIPIAAIHYEPMGVYSCKISSLSEVPEGGIVSIPSDPSNFSRALCLLKDLKINHKSLKIIEIDAPLLPRTLEDVTIALIPLNIALLAQLTPIAIEEASTRYQNVLVVRAGDETKEDIQVLEELLTSDEVKKFILRKYKGNILPIP